MNKVASYIDHTLLKSSCTAADIQKLCDEAKQYNFVAVCVPPNYVALAADILKQTQVKIATVIGFPFGYNNTSSKLAEIHQAIKDGADELDMVHNICAVKNSDYAFLSKEVAACLQPIRLHNKCLKVIIESGILTDQEIINSCEVYAKHKVDYVKTSTGYAEVGATLSAVQLMRAHLPEEIAIKASGGIRDYTFTQQLIAAGATRIGTSAGIKITEEATTGLENN